MDRDELRVEVRDHVATVTLCRPAARNALTMSLKQALGRAFDDLAKHDEVWGVIVTGEGTAFCAGGDITEFPDTPQEASAMAGHAQGVFDTIERLPKPVVAAVNGCALGGGLELALSCDLRVMSRRATLGFPEAQIGALPCYGGFRRLVRLVGVGVAKDLIMTARSVDAEEAHALRIVNRLCEPGEELCVAEGLLRRVTSNSPAAVALAKEGVEVAADHDLACALAFERHAIGLLAASDEFREGCSAFLEKRPPDFRHA